MKKTIRSRRVSLIESLSSTLSRSVGSVALLAAAAFAVAQLLHPSPSEAGLRTPILADMKLLNAVGIPALAVESSTHVGFAEVSSQEQNAISAKAHEWNRCGGYEDLSATASVSRELITARSATVQNAFRELAIRHDRDQAFTRKHALIAVPALDMRPEVKAAVDQVITQNVKDTVDFYSSFHTRFNHGDKPNEAPEALKARIEAVLKSAKIPYQVEFISHNSTEQKSVHVRLPGALRPNEIVVLGGHLDSINVGWWGTDAAPGADDNASGTADLIEALRIVIAGPQPERTLDFMWYAGEESGLLGSAEIAQAYKAANADVVGVLQLDMTLHPGAGAFVLGSMTDFTSSWMRNYLVGLNDMYIHAKIVDDQCGYGCSDHASWYRSGYPTIMPFEATFNTMNPYLHTAKDVVNEQSNFEHAAMFAKLAVAIAVDLGNSTDREPAN